MSGLAAAALVAFLALSTPAFAYLDPGTGSFVLQMVLASIVAVGASVKLFWATIKQTLLKMLPRGKAGRAEIR
jgi:hypothetical protein